jgi:hypothetical protein
VTAPLTRTELEDYEKAWASDECLCGKVAAHFRRMADALAGLVNKVHRLENVRATGEYDPELADAVDALPEGWE